VTLFASLSVFVLVVNRAKQCIAAFVSKTFFAHVESNYLCSGNVA